MRTLKRFVSVVAAISMAVSTFAAMVTVSAAETDIIYENFGDGFVIDNTAKTIETSSGFTVTTPTEGSFDETYLKKADGALYMNGRVGNGSWNNTNVYFDFSEAVSGKTYIAFDFKMANFCPNGPNFGGDFFTVGNTEKAAIRLLTGNQKQASAGGVAGITHNGEVLAAKDSEWHKIEILVDMDTKKYDITVDGVKKANNAFKSAVDSISRLSFVQQGTYYNWAGYADNIIVCKDTDNNRATVTFHNGSEVIESQSVICGSAASFPADIPSKPGKVFMGWAAADGTMVNSDYLNMVVNDIDLYAQFRDSVSLKETFEDGFEIDYSNKRISSNSGFSLSAADAAYDNASQFKTEDGAMKLVGMVYNSAAYDTNFYMDFPGITSGTVKIAFDIKPINYGYSTGHNGVIFGIGNSSMTDGTNVEKNAIAYAENGNSSQKAKGIFTEDGTQIKDKTTGTWITIEYIITMPDGENAGQYSVYADGELIAENKAFKNNLTSISRIIFSQKTDGEAKFRNSNNYIDNVEVIENPSDEVSDIEITKDLDGGSFTLADGQVLTAPEGVKLTNTTIDTGNSYAVIGKSTYRGKFTFNADGKLDIAAGDTAVLSSAASDGSLNYGVLQKCAIDGKSSYTMNVYANGEAGGKTYNNVKAEVKFDFSDAYKGNAIFRLIVTGTPDTVTLSGDYGALE